MPTWLQITLIAVASAVVLGVAIYCFVKKCMPTWVKVVLGIALVVGLGALVIYCIATAKDMTFVDFIKSLFPAKEVADTASALANIKIGG